VKVQLRGCGAIEDVDNDNNNNNNNNNSNNNKLLRKCSVRDA
jgi:hypothetical protein